MSISFQKKKKRTVKKRYKNQAVVGTSEISDFVHFGSRFIPIRSGSWDEQQNRSHDSSWHIEGFDQEYWLKRKASQYKKVRK